MNVNQYLDAAKLALHCATDCDLARRFGVVQSRITHYRKGKVLPNVHMARKIARALNMRSATVISDIRREKAVRQPLRLA